MATNIKSIKIKSVKSLGKRDVYDIEMPSCHNFILDNGAVAHNCSHATCYAITAYACAYLKHHYPIEWWTGTLNNAHKDDISEKFWKSCGKYVNVPDIVKSSNQYQIHGDKILAPISLLLGVGDKAHEQLCACMPYSSLEDFCQKIIEWKKTKRNALNAGVISSMILVGTMDSLFEPGLSALEKMNKYIGVMKGFDKKFKFDLKYISLNQWDMYAIKKRVLSIYSESLLKTALERMEPGIEVSEKGSPTFTCEVENRVMKLPLVEYHQLEDMLSRMMWTGPVKVACVGRVQSTRHFSFTKAGKKKEAASFTIDFGYIIRDMVKWSGQDGKIPKHFKSVQEGGIYFCVLDKYKEDKPFSIVEMIPIHLPEKKNE